MTSPNFPNELYANLLEERATLKDQINIIDPLATTLSRPAAQRLLQKGFNILLEIICWTLALGSIVFLFFRDKIYPFYVWEQIRNNNTVLSQYSENEVAAFNWVTIAVFILIAFLWMTIALQLKSVRKKNAIIHESSKHLKKLAQITINRNAEVETLYHKNYEQQDLAIPPDTPPASTSNHNDILL